NWTGDPDGIPPTAMGGTYQVAFPTPGSKVVVAQCKPALQYKTIKVQPSCDQLSSPSAPQTFRIAAAVPGNAFGFVGAADSVAPAYASCGRGSQVCLSLTSLAIGHGFGVDGGGDIDISGPDDPQITGTNCADVIADFTPFTASLGPPRTKYWSSKITTDHELVHETRQLPGQVDNPLF